MTARHAVRKPTPCRCPSCLSASVTDYPKSHTARCRICGLGGPVAGFRVINQPALPPPPEPYRGIPAGRRELPARGELNRDPFEHMKLAMLARAH